MIFNYISTMDIMDIALVMNINIQDFANMFDALGPYFQRSDHR